MVSPSQSGEPLLRAGCQNMCAHRASASRRRIRRVAKGVAERGGRHATRAVFQHLDERHVRRRAVHFVAMAHEAEEPRRRASASTSAVSRVLPTPGSPDTMTIDPRPARAASRPARSSKRAVSQPTSGKRVLPRPIDGTTGAAEERPDRRRVEACRARADASAVSRSNSMLDRYRPLICSRSLGW